MDFELTREQKVLIEEVRNFLKAFPDEYWREKDAKHEYPWEFDRAVAKTGYLGIALPEEYDGAGLKVFDAALLLEEVAACGAMNASSSVHTTIFTTRSIVEHGTPEQKEFFLRKVANGELTFAIGLTEPEAGINTLRITTRAVKDGDDYVITGRKMFLSRAKEADYVWLLTRTTPFEEAKKKTDGLSVFLVPLKSEGIQVQELHKLGRNAVDTNAVFFDKVRVPALNLLGGTPDVAFQQIFATLNPERIFVAASAIGMGRGAIERAVRYVKERRVWGPPIGIYQSVQHPLADSYADMHLARLMMYKAAWLYDQGLPCGPESNMAKLKASEFGFRATDRALQVFGGNGYIKDYDVERFWKESRLFRIGPIPQEMVLNYLAEHVLGLPRSY